MGTIKFNGHTFSGNDITITGDSVFIDGAKVDAGKSLKNVTELHITGNFNSLATDRNVSCGDIHGDVAAGGNVNSGKVNGDVTAGGNINCGKVGGDVNAGGNVHHG